MRAYALGLLVMAVVGCKGVEPVGPLKGMWATDPPKSSKSAKEKDAKDMPPKPVTVPAVKPTPPLSYVYPDEVSLENPLESVQKLKSELDAEGKNIPSPPVTAEVSYIKGGVKQN